MTNLCKRLVQEKIEIIDQVYLKLENAQKIELLSQLLEQDTLDVSKMQDLNDVYKIGDTENSEILFK